MGLTHLCGVNHWLSTGKSKQQTTRTDSRGTRVMSAYALILWCFPPQKDMVPDDYDRRDPEHKTIYRFIRTLFNAAQLTAECAIVTLVSRLSADSASQMYGKSASIANQTFVVYKGIIRRYK